VHSIIVDVDGRCGNGTVVVHWLVFFHAQCAAGFFGSVAKNKD